MENKGKEEETKINFAQEQTLSPDEIKRLADFFSILLEIDKRLIKAKKYGKNN